MSSSPVLLFDGHCNLCSSSVQFIIRHDPKGVIQFAALQSEAGQALLDKVGQRLEDLPDSVILYDQQQIYVESEAALRVARYLDKPFRWLFYFRFLPRSFRDTIYRWIARNRYVWFGVKEECWIPTPDLKARFLS